MTLFVNACVGEHSRTERIARAYLKHFTDVEEVCLETMYMEPLDDALLQQRNQCIARGDYTHGYFESARKFAEADEIVVAAPFWDMSFPAKLRIYLENICIPGLTFRYSPEGIPIGMCRAAKLTYITSSGGRYFPDFSYRYIQSLASGFFGIQDTSLICAENLDIAGNDPQEIVSSCIRRCCG